MTFANVLKILVLIATVASLVAPIFQAISPEVAAIISGIGAGILAFTAKIGTTDTQAVSATRVNE